MSLNETGVSLKKKVLTHKKTRKRDPSNIKRDDKPKRRKRHLKEPARLKAPKEGSTKGRKKIEGRETRKKKCRPL
jgi:hypothetical protein